MSEYRYSIYFKIKALLTVMVYLFLLILSGIKLFHGFSIRYMLLGIFSAVLLLLWIHFFVNRPCLYLDEEGYDFLPRRGLSKLGKKVYWKNIVRVRRHWLLRGALRLYIEHDIPEAREGTKIISRENIALHDYQEKKKLLQEIINYCQHAEIDPRITKIRP